MFAEANPGHRGLTSAAAQPGAPAAIDPAEVGSGLGLVSGLLLGAAVGSFLVMGLAWRDARLARAGLLRIDPSPAGLAFVRDPE